MLQITLIMIILEEHIWMIVVGFIVAFVLAFGIGANDVANSFGTSVGSRVLTLRRACTLATICELAGAILLGANVSNTIRKGIVNIDMFIELQNGPAVLMAGQVAALGGSCIWLLVATFFRLPVSGTHSIVGATMGFSVIVLGFGSIKWIGVMKIVSSWFISPLLSGLTSVGMFYLLRYMILTKAEPLEPALRLLPAFYGIVMVVNIFSILYDGPPMLRFNEIPLYGVFLLSFGLGAITAIAVKLFWVPYLRRRIMNVNAKRASLTDRLKLCHPAKIRIVSQQHKTKQQSESTQTDIRSSSSDEFVRQLSSDLSTEGKTVNSQMGAYKPKEENRNAASVKPGNENVEQTKKAIRRKSKYQCCCLGYPKTTRTVPTTIEMIAHDKNFSNDPMHTPPVEALSIDKSDEGITENSGTPNKPVSSNTQSLSRKDQHGSRKLERVKDRPEEAKVFALLQIVTAVFGSFAHGGNDVSNAIGPLIGLWIIGTTQTVNSESPTPIWILCYGGLGIAVGLWIWGRRVIQTLGNDLTHITPSTGVCIEIGSALTVLIASKIGLPISTTHCKVGSVVGVGRARSKDSVNWGIFRNILIAWLVTMPAAGSFSALLMYCFTFVV